MPGEREKEIADWLENFLTRELGAAVAKINGALLDYEADPKVAAKVARGKKVLLDALLAEGFSRGSRHSFVSQRCADSGGRCFIPSLYISTSTVD
jgi:hypothetical protein